MLSLLCIELSYVSCNYKDDDDDAFYHGHLPILISVSSAVQCLRSLNSVFTFSLFYCPILWL